jgi:hypothetical protein
MLWKPLEEMYWSTPADSGGMIDLKELGCDALTLIFPGAALLSQTLATSTSVETVVAASFDFTFPSCFFLSLAFIVFAFTILNELFSLVVDQLVEQVRRVQSTGSRICNYQYCRRDGGRID